MLWVVVLGLGSSGFAQALSAFVERAATENVDGRLAIEARVRAEAELGQAWGALLPAFTANGGWTHNQYNAVLDFPTGLNTTKSVTITPTDQLDVTLKVELPLIDPARWLKTSSSAASSEAAVAREKSAREQIKRQVATAWFAWVSAHALHASAQRSLETARSQLEVTSARTQAGVANELELVRAQAEVERNQQLVADAESLIATSARSLNTLSGLRPTEAPPLQVDDLTEEKPLADLESGLSQLPQVVAAERDAEAARRAWTAATLALVPSINGQFTERLTNATGFQGQNALYNLGVNFNWRLDVPAVHALRAQRSAQSTAALNAEKALQSASDQLHSDWQRVHTAIVKVRSAKAQVTAAHRASALAHERYSAGVATQLDVIQAERDALVAEVNDIQALAELGNARASLRLSAGQEL